MFYLQVNLSNMCYHILSTANWIQIPQGFGRSNVSSTSPCYIETKAISQNGCNFNTWRGRNICVYMLLESQDWKEGLTFLANCIIHLYMVSKSIWICCKRTKPLSRPNWADYLPLPFCLTASCSVPVSPGSFSMANKTNELFLYQFYCLHFFSSCGT